VSSGWPLATATAPKRPGYSLGPWGLVHLLVLQRKGTRCRPRPVDGCVGSAYANPMVESFWGRMQVELFNRKRWTTRIEFATSVHDYIEPFHNTRLRHSALGCSHQPSTRTYTTRPNGPPDTTERQALFAQARRFIQGQLMLGCEAASMRRSQPSLSVVYGMNFHSRSTASFLKILPSSDAAFLPNLRTSLGNNAAGACWIKCFNI
jgi:Integrase core domain